MSTFKFNPLTLRRGSCGICAKQVNSGEECCWIMSFQGVNPKTLDARWGSTLAHAECARKKGYIEMTPDQPAWLKRPDLEAFAKARCQHTPNK
jgi:hypothetical protein